jgi:UMF1 family MFS transporter
LPNTIPRRKIITRPVFSWAFYDWANSAFATTVMAGFFPVFFKQYWSANADSTVSTFQLGMGNTIAGIAIVVLAPVLGAIADKAGVCKRNLLIFASLGILMTGGLYTVQQGDWLSAIILYGVATVGFMGANIFYDAMIVSVVQEERRDWVSSLGYALGYLGGGVLFAINVAMTLAPEFFGIANSAEAVRLSFITVAVWWTVFSIPLILYVKEPARPHVTHGMSSVRQGFRQVFITLGHVRQIKNVWLFLLAYWCYIDGVDTIVRMAVDYGLSLGMEQKDLITALLITQFVGFPAALAFGWLGQRLGAKPSLFIGLLAYSLITLWAVFMREAWEFYTLAIAIGLVQGGVQALSRSLFAGIIPASRAGEFFGFYNMMGKFATILGPALVGGLSLATGSHRIGILSILILFIVGGALLSRVQPQRFTTEQA